MPLALMNYVDKPGRDLSPVDPNAIVWIDWEYGAFVDNLDVGVEYNRLRTQGFRPGIYATKSGVEELLQHSSFTWPQDMLLWLADWGVEPIVAPFDLGQPNPPMMQQFQRGPFAGINADISLDFEGHLWADISNWTELTDHQAWLLKNAMYGVVIGLQDTKRALEQKRMLLA